VGEHALEGRVCLVTGATSGLGLATARGLADLGATVLLVSRDPARGIATRDEIRLESPHATIEVFFADMSVQAEVRALASAVMAAHPRLHVLVNNAGALFSTWEHTPDGLERTFAINYLAPFLLTQLLLPLLLASAPARIVNVTSDLHRFGKLDPDDPSGERTRDMMGAYSRSKLALVLFTFELAGKLAGSGVTVNCLHPGMVASGLSRDAHGPLAWLASLLRLARLSRPPDESAKSAIYLAAAPEVAHVSGQYFSKAKRARPSATARDRALATRLWSVTEDLLALGV
jgi:NAD(P)-dependent dehydrogenase (short-subunit alcohol dehydrogenase family)